MSGPKCAVHERLMCPGKFNRLPAWYVCTRQIKVVLRIAARECGSCAHATRYDEFTSAADLEKYDDDGHPAREGSILPKVSTHGLCVPLH